MIANGNHFDSKFAAGCTPLAQGRHAPAALNDHIFHNIGYGSTKYGRNCNLSADTRRNSVLSHNPSMERPWLAP